jgi:hypothetical protein
VAPLVYHQLKTVGLIAPGSAIPDEVQRYLQTAYYHSAAQNTVFFGELERVLAALTAGGIQPVVLKGAALAAEIYPASALRPMGDLDLLIRPGDLGAARRILETLGYCEERYPELSSHFSRVIGSHIIMRSSFQTDVVVELHWSLLNWARIRSMDWFWEQTTPRGAGGLALTPTAHTLYLAAHLGFHHYAQPRLIWLYDLHLAIAVWAEAIDWALLTRQASQLGWGSDLYSIFLEVQGCFAMALPVDLTLLFERAGVDTRAAPRPQAKKRLHKAWSALSALSLHDRGRLVLSALLPGREYINFTYRPPMPWLLPLYYPVHWVGIALAVIDARRRHSFHKPADVAGR